MKVKLIEKFNMSVGTVLVVKAADTLKIGDRITAEDKEYTIKAFMHPTGAFAPDLISVIVQ